MSFRVVLSSRCRTWLIFLVVDNVTNFRATAESSCCPTTSWRRRSRQLSPNWYLRQQVWWQGYAPLRVFFLCGYFALPLTKRFSDWQVYCRFQFCPYNIDVSFTHTIIQGVINQILKTRRMLLVKMVDIATTVSFVYVLYPITSQRKDKILQWRLWNSVHTFRPNFCCI